MKNLNNIGKTVLIISVFLVLAFQLSFAAAEQTGSYDGSLEVGASGSGTVIVSGPGSYQGFCGNGHRDSGEECDEADLNGATCSILLGNSYSGTLACKTTCTYDYLTGCINTNTTGNGGTTDDGGSSGSSSSGGGGSAGSGFGVSAVGSCIENWQCTEWGICQNTTQQRYCVDLNNCATTTFKPTEARECFYEGKYGEEGISPAAANQTTQQGLLSRITGAVIGGGTGSIIAGALLVLIILIAAAVLFAKKR